jgi:hypothetical protein
LKRRLLVTYVQKLTLVHIWRAILVGFAAGVVCGAWPSSRLLAQNTSQFPKRKAQSGQAVIHLCATGSRVAYVGSRVCAECHPDIYASFKKSRMGRSMTLPQDAGQISLFDPPTTIHEPSLDRYFQVSAQAGDLYQTEYQRSPEGNDVFRETRKIAFVVGGGQTGFGYLVARGQYLFEAPLSYYSNLHQWELSPGYQYSDYGFDRPILTECIFCHSGRSRPVSGRPGMYEDPPFKELSVGCENCHGPGALHVEERRKAEPLKNSVDPSIVNPGKLTPWLANNVCMACHENGDDRVPQPGKTGLDYCPGTSLDNTIAIFSVPLRRGAADKSPLLQHYSLMILSQCYLQSGGELTCLSCHDPHVQPEGAEAVRFYRQKCLGCHNEASCSLPLVARMKQALPDDCAGCHMPKKKVAMISHSALTNHRIIARPDEPLPESAYHQATRGLPDLVHVSANPGQPSKPVSPVVLLHAYSDLIAHFPEYRKAHDDLLTEFAKTGSSDPFVLSELARQGILENRPQSLTAAAGYLTKALQQGSTEPTDFEMLANLLAGSGKNEEAVELLTRGLALDPYATRLYKSLALQYIKVKQYDSALTTMKKELEVFPHDSLMRSLIKRVEEGSR